MISKYRFIRSILIVYMCVLIPVLVVSFLVTEKTFKQSEEREKELLCSVLQEIVDELDEWYNEFQNQTSALGEMLELTPSSVLGNSENARQAIRRIRNVNVFNGRTKDIFVYYGIGKIYSSKGLVNQRTYFDTTLGCLTESTDKGITAMASVFPSITLLQTRSGECFLMYHFPIQKNYTGYCISAQFILSVQCIEDMLGNYVSGNELMFQFTIGDKKLYFQVNEGNCKTLKMDEFQELQNSGNIVLRQETASMDISTELLFCPEVSWAELRELQVLNIGLLILGITISIMVSFIFSYFRWGKFKELTNGYNLDMKTKSNSKKLNTEYDYIRIILEQSSLESEQIKQDSKQYRQEMLHQIATMIFHGMVTDSNTVQNMMEMCARELSEEYYYLCGMAFDDNEKLLFNHDMIFQDTLHCIGQLDGQKVLIFLAEGAVPDPECTERINLANSLLNNLQSYELICKRCVFSQVYNSISMINYAYLEVCGLLENPLESECIVECWDSYIGIDCPKRKQTDQIERFMDALEERNYDKIETVLHQIIKNLEEERKSWKYYICYCIRQAVILTVRKEEADSALLMIITEIDPIHESNFEEKILKVIKKICDKEKRAYQLEQALKYVEDNYHRYDLSLEEVALALDMNKSQMSKLFKSQHSQGYLEYLTNIRMEKARELLTGTELSVKNIIHAVGYIDKTSFTRKFKKNYGMLPTEYRINMRNGSREMMTGGNEDEEID